MVLFSVGLNPSKNLKNNVSIIFELEANSLITGVAIGISVAVCIRVAVGGIVAVGIIVVVAVCWLLIVGLCWGD